MSDTPDRLNTIEFGTLNPDGTYTVQRILNRDAIQQCPHYIMMAEHYRDDGTCKCDDPNETIMADWEYTWDAEQGRWV